MDLPFWLIGNNSAGAANVAILEMDITVICHGNLRVGTKHTAVKQYRSTTINSNSFASSTIHMVEYDSACICKVNFRIKKLTAAEYKAIMHIDDLDSNSRIVTTVVKDAAYSRTMGIICFVRVCVIHKKTYGILGEVAIYKHIISAVVDTAIVAGCCMYVRKPVKLRPKRNI